MLKKQGTIFLLTTLVLSSAQELFRQVTIEQGTVQGAIGGNDIYYEFLGIPYATNNSSTRFKAALPPPSWDGVFIANRTVMCAQAFFPSGVEDCLVANIYVPVAVNEPLPVMLFVHGGAFYTLSGAKEIYDPVYLVEHDVIVVTINYRLGALGFLCLGTEDAPGNAGLKDQLAALRWVKENIAAFGGNSDDITLFGQSAGGASVSHLLANKATENLISKVIIHSGSATAHWGVNRIPLETASYIARSLGYNVEDPQELYNLFSQMDVAEILSSPVEWDYQDYVDSKVISYPCVENEIPGVEAFITDLPYNVFNKRQFNIPIMYGAVSQEGLFLLADETEESLMHINDLYMFGRDLEFDSDEEKLATSERVRHYYFGTEPVSMENRMGLGDYYADLFFVIPVLLETEIVISKSNAAVYNYWFNYIGNRNHQKSLSGFPDLPGAEHGDDLYYIFEDSTLQLPMDEKDRNMTYLMTKMWTNFAKYGNPTPESSDLATRWLPSDSNGLNLLYIDDEVQMGPIPNLESYEMWKDIYERYRQLELYSSSWRPISAVGMIAFAVIIISVLNENNF